LKIISYKFCY